jgi:hypothetical protein
MKTLFLFLFLSIIIFPQDILENANTIIINTSDSPEDAFKNIGKILMKDGYTLENVDKTFLMLVTKPSSVNFGLMNMQNLDLKISSEILENPTRIKMVCEFMNRDICKALNLAPDFDLRKDRAKNTSGDYASAFELMDVVAKKYPNGKIEYLIEEVKD